MDNCKVLHRGYLGYTTSNRYTKYLDREDQGWASVKVGKPYKPLGEPILDFCFKKKTKDNSMPSQRETVEVVGDAGGREKPGKATTQDQDKSSVRALLQLCNPRRMGGRTESDAIRQRIHLSNHRIRTIRTGGRMLPNDGSTALEKRIAKIDDKLRCKGSERVTSDAARKRKPTSGRANSLQGIRESHKNTPLAQWLSFTERTQTRATQSAATLNYFSARGMPAPPAGQILRQVRRESPHDDAEDDNGDLPDRAKPRRSFNPLQTLARCYADFDLTKNDLRERLVESLSLMDNNRDALIQVKYHDFVPTFDCPEGDIYDMRDQAEAIRHAVVMRRHQNYAWLHLLVQYADKQAHAEGAEMPSAEEADMIYTIFDVVDTDDNLDMDFAGFRKIVLGIDPAYFNIKEVRKLLTYVQKMFDLTTDQYHQCLQEAGFEDDDRFPFASRRRTRTIERRTMTPRRPKKSGFATARNSNLRPRSRTPTMPQTARPKSKPTRDHHQKLQINPDMMEYKTT